MPFRFSFHAEHALSDTAADEARSETVRVPQQAVPFAGALPDQVHAPHHNITPFRPITPPYAITITAVIQAFDT